MRERIAQGLSSPAIATAIAAWMHFVVKTAQTPGATLSDPLAADILAQAKKQTDPAGIIDSLLALDKIFGTDLPENAAFCADLTAKFIELAKNPAVSTAAEIKL